MFTSGIFLLLGLLAVALGLSLYFLPTIIAQQKRHRSLGGIFVLNLLLGWSLLGWIVALVWALSNPQPVVIVQNNPAYMQPGAPLYPQQPMYPQQPGYAPPTYAQPPVYPQPVQAAPLLPPEPAGYVAQPAVVFTPLTDAESASRSDPPRF